MIGTQQHGDVTVLTLERPAQRNALDVEHVHALLAAATAAVEAGSRCIVITGAGSAFCAGADLDEVRTPGFTLELAALLRGLVRLPVPVICAVNGPAIGAGTQLAIACDLRVGAPAARFAVPTVRLGLALDPWSIQRLISLVGGGPARALLVGADGFDVQRAHVVGLVDRLGDLDAALAWAHELATLAPMALAFNKLALNRVAAGGDLDAEQHGDALDPAVEKGFAGVWASQDSWEGIRARAEGRPPRFDGR